MTSYILLTGIVYHFLLQNGNNPIPGLFVADAGASIGNWSQFLLHYVVPIMVLIDWLTVGPRLRVRWRDGLLWAIFPLGYALVMIARGLVLPAVSDRYPYPFFDPTTNGWDGVWSTLTELIIVYLIIVAIVIALDRLLVRVGHRELGPS